MSEAKTCEQCGKSFSGHGHAYANTDSCGVVTGTTTVCNACFQARNRADPFWQDVRREQWREAQRRRRQRRRRQRKKLVADCIACGAQFQPERADAKTCSTRCRKRKQRAEGRSHT